MGKIIELVPELTQSGKSRFEGNVTINVDGNYLGTITGIRCKVAPRQWVEDVLSNH